MTLFTENSKNALSHSEKNHKILKWCKRHSGTCYPMSFSAHLHAPLIHDALRRCLLAGPQTPQARSPQSPRAAEEILAWITLACISHVQPPQSCKSLLGYLVLWSFLDHSSHFPAPFTSLFSSVALVLSNVFHTHTHTQRSRLKHIFHEADCYLYCQCYVLRAITVPGS